MWGGDQPGPQLYNRLEGNSIMEVFHLVTGRWEQKRTTGTPPPGVVSYAAAAIGNEIFYYGGSCDLYGCYYNSLYCLNVDTFNWKTLSHNAPHDVCRPMMKDRCGMVAVQLDGEKENYLVVIGGMGSSKDDTRYVRRCDEIHYYKLSSRQ